MSSRDAHLETLREALASGDQRRAYDALCNITRDPDADLCATHAMAGIIAFDLGAHDDARRHLERAEQLETNDPDARARLALLVSDEVPSRALTILSELQATLPPWSAPLCAKLLVDLRGDLSGAASCLADGLSKMAATERAPWLGEAASLSLRIGSVEVALQVLRWCDELSKSGPLTELLSGLFHLAEWDDLINPELGAQLDELLMRLGERAKAEESMHAYAMTRARRLLSQRMADEAHRWALVALEALPGDVATQVFALEVQVLSGDMEGARKALKGRAHDPQVSEETWLSLAKLFRDQERHDEATQMLQEVLAARPERSGLWLELSRFLTDLGREQDALAAYEQAIALEPELDDQASQLHANVRQIITGLPNLLEHVGAGEVRTIHSMRFGHNALVASITAGGERLYAKIFMPGRRTQRHVEDSARLMKAIGEQMQGLAIPTPRGEGLSCQGLPALVMSEIPGTSLRRDLRHPRATMTPSHAQSLGRALATLHNTTATLRDFARHAPPGMGSALGDVVRAHQAGWPMLRPGGRLHREAPRMAGPVLDAITPIGESTVALVDALERGVIHGDFGWHNLTWSGTQASGILDFDYANQDYLIADLLNGIHRTAFDWFQLELRGDPKPRPELGRAIFDAYVETRCITPPPTETLDVLFSAVRIPYYLNLASAGIAQRGHAAPQTYARVDGMLSVLLHQLRWLASRGGISSILS